MSPRILIATPVKDATSHLDAHFALLNRLRYPRARITLAYLESDSRDGTLEALRARLAEAGRRYRRYRLLQQNMGFHLPPGTPRTAPEIQLARRAALARSRNHLLSRALDDEDWVLWLDVDVIDAAPDLIDRLLATGKDIVHPHCADARELPFEDQTFDAVYLVTALGEIPEPGRVLAAAARVLKPGGRLVVGEFFDRHWIPFGRLHRLADTEGLHLTARRGPSVAYLARFRPCAAA